MIDLINVNGFDETPLANLIKLLGISYAKPYSHLNWREDILYNSHKLAINKNYL